jgi:hypothetical protein
VSAYNPEARCPKCGYDCVTTKYGEPENMPHYGARAFHSGYAHADAQNEKWKLENPILAKEHLKRECVRCSYKWEEECQGLPLNLPDPSYSYVSREMYERLIAKSLALSLYAQHLRTCATRQIRDCAFRPNETPTKCDCGLEELL